MRFPSILGLGFVAVVVACHGGPGAHHGGDAEHPALHGTCNPSSVVTTTVCAKRTIPASNASSSWGCKSDAECKDGIEGRCIKTSTYPNSPSGSLHVRSPLLAGPPAPIPPTVCEYDRCNANSECGEKTRCNCGEASARNTCVQLDACLADTDCGLDRLCDCGGDGSPNQCISANCRTDADCGGVSGACRSGETGRFCATASDSCKTTDDCHAKSEEYQVCDYDRSVRSWQCRVVPPRPAG